MMSERMTTHRHYERPPVVEAVFEAFGPLTDSQLLDQPALAELLARVEELRETLRERYQGSEDSVNPVGLEVEIGPAGAHSGFRHEPTRHRLRSADGTKLVQIAPQMVAFNALPPYGHYVEYLPEIEDVFTAWLDVVRPTALEFIGQRYINQILLPPSSDPAEFFSIYPRLPAGIGVENPPLAMQMRLQELSSGAVVVNLGLQQEQAQGALYLLDLYARSSPDQPIEPEWHSIATWLNEAHEAIGTAFEMAITPNSQRLFGLEASA